MKKGRQDRIAETLTGLETGERKVKACPSPANADEQDIVKDEGYFLEMIILVYRRKVMSVTTTP